TVLPTVLPDELADRSHGLVNGSFSLRLPGVELARGGAPCSSDSTPVEVAGIAGLVEIAEPVHIGAQLPDVGHPVHVRRRGEYQISRLEVLHTGAGVAFVD